MNEKIANILKDRIKELPFVDKIAGLVRPMKIEVIGDNNTKSQKTFPIASDVSVKDVDAGKYKDLIPQSKYNSIVYFEDNGTTVTYRDRDRIGFNGRLTLVGWLNVPKLFECGIKTGSTEIILQIIKQLPGDHFSVGDFREIRIIALSEIVKSNAVFSRYTYDELKTQYLLFPFDFFALNMSIDYWINLKCIDNFICSPCPTC